MESALVEWMSQIVDRAPRPLAGAAAWVAASVYYTIVKVSDGYWFFHFCVTMIFAAVIPTVALVTSFQENVEWLLRVFGLLFAMSSSGFTLVLAWPKVKSATKKIFKKPIRRKR